MNRCVVLALLLGGCVPSALWAARSPDRAVRASVFAEGGAHRLAIEGGRDRVFDAVAVDRVTWSDRGIVAPAERAGAWWIVDGADERGPYDAVSAITVAGAHVAFAAGRQDGWRVVVDGREGAPFEAIGEEIQLDAESGTVLYVAQRRGEELAVWNERVGPACTSIAMASLGAKGRLAAYVDRGDRDRLLVDHEEAGVFDEVLELALASDEPHWSAIVGAEGCSLVHDGRVIASAPLLTHLRISDDGAHVACLSPAEDGSSIDVLRDGASVAHHRRVEGSALAFVPGTGTLVFLAEDSQGARVVVGDRETERYEEIDGPVYAPGRVGWIGRRGQRSEIEIDGEMIAEEEWAGALRLAREGTGYAYVARASGERFVVTRRGRWPVPRLFVDTLVVDETAHHWGALVPDRSEHRLVVWIDGVPHGELGEEDLGGALSGGTVEPSAAVRAVVAGELARATSR